MEANMGRRFSWLFLLCIDFVFIAEPAMFHARAAGPPRNANVSFELYRDYLIVLQARVGPLRGLNFLLDTGATPSVLDPHIAAKLHLKAVPTEIAVLQGTARGATATVPSLQIGPVVKENLPVLVEDLSFVQKVVPVHLDGIVGLDVLGQIPFTISYREHEIKFGPTPALTTSVPLAGRQGLAMMTAIVNDQPVRLLLDTGAPSLILFKHLAVPGIKTTGLDVPTKSIGDYEHKPLRLSSLNLGAASFSQPLAYFVPSPGDSAHDFDGLMSPAALGITRLAIDLGREEMSFSGGR
jgi:predicted aspartyl protease